MAQDKMTFAERMERIDTWCAISAKSVLNSREAAQYLGITPDTLYRLARDRALPSCGTGRKYYVKSDLDNYLANLGTRTRTRAEVEAEAASVLQDIRQRREERQRNKAYKANK